MTRWQSVAWLGAKTRRLLASGGGRIQAASTKAVYLLSDGGQLIWPTTERVPMDRRGGRVVGIYRKTVGQLSPRLVEIDHTTGWDWLTGYGRRCCC